MPYFLRLTHPNKGVVETIQADDEGHFAFPYKHKGKPADYVVEIASDEGFTDIVSSATVYLQGNGWYEVTFTATECGEFTEVWEAAVTYGKPPKKKGGKKK